MKNKIFILFFSLLGLFTQAQNGLESIYVEKYYLSDANDATGSLNPLPVGSVTYRIYADMLPGYKVQNVFGSVQHNLLMNTTTEFFNSADGLITGVPTISAGVTKSNTNMIDSYLTTGRTCTGWMGILKSEDDALNNFVNLDGLLQNNDPYVGIPLTTRDGMKAQASLPSLNTIGLDGVIGVFADGTTNGNQFLVTNGGWYCTLGAAGPVPATNKVLIAQITTDGIFHFELNILIGTPTAGVSETYVSSNPTGAEITIPSLTQTLYPVAPCASTTWSGAVNENWLTAGNWVSGCIPQPTTDVLIPSGCVHYPTVTGAAECHNLTINDGASLITNSSFNMTGTATVNRTFPGLSSYHFLSSPVASTTFGEVFPLNQLAVWAYNYNELTGNWDNQTTASSLAVGTGYSVKATQSQTAIFSGQLNKQAVTKSLQKLNPGVDANRKGWNLLGNPFTCALDWDLMGTGMGVSVWDESMGNWRVRNAGVGNLTDGIIPAQNGFFVQAATNGESFTIPTTGRVHSSQGFLKNNISNVLAVKAIGTSGSDDAFISFNDNATDAYDRPYDVRKLWGNESAPQLYTMAAEEILSINTLPLNAVDAVDMGFKCGNSGSYSLMASGMESFDAGNPVWIEDLKTNSAQDLRVNPLYTFEYTAGDSELRFRLHFKSAYSVPENSLKSIAIFAANKVVVIKNSDRISGTVSIFDLAGRELLKTNMTNESETRIPVNFTEGTYIVKVTSENGVSSNKVFIR